MTNITTAATINISTITTTTTTNNNTIITLTITNITNTTNTTAPSCEWSYPVGACPFLIITSLAIIAENVIGIAVIYSTPFLHTTTNIFVCSMAVTDIAAGLACLVANGVILLSSLSDGPDNVASYGLGIVLVIFALVILSCAHMALIALERYLYIAHPFTYRKYMNQRTITGILIIFWVVSTIFVCALFGRYFSNITLSICRRQLPAASDLIFSLTVYTLSVIISCLVYARITKISMVQKRRHMHQSSIRLDSIEDQKKHRSVSDKSKKGSLDDQRKRSVIQKEKMFKETMKSIKFFVIVFGIFLLFTLPAAVMFIVDKLIVHVTDTLFRLVTAPAFFITGVNFIVLTLLNSHFKEALKMKVSAFCRRRRSDG